VINIIPLDYKGASAGSEFLTYAANKLYVAISFEVSYSASTAVPNAARLDIYNHLNALCFCGCNTIPVWNTTLAALRYVEQNCKKENFYFGRIVCNVYNYIKFNGYRITRN
jgi:hypothetical protein